MPTSHHDCVTPYLGKQRIWECLDIAAPVLPAEFRISGRVWRDLIQRFIHAIEKPLAEAFLFALTPLRARSMSLRAARVRTVFNVVARFVSRRFGLVLIPSSYRYLRLPPVSSRLRLLARHGNDPGSTFPRQHRMATDVETRCCQAVIRPSTQPSGFVSMHSRVSARPSRNRHQALLSGFPATQPRR